jgi:hypothetical protein
MLSIALAIQNGWHQTRSMGLVQTAQASYMRHMNDISCVRDIIKFHGPPADAIKIQFDRIEALLKRYSNYLSLLRLNYKIGQPCFWMLNNIGPKYSLDELAVEMNHLDASIKSEIYSCRKKLYKRYRRRSSRVRVHSY